jgi:membrane dipeptidase
MITTTLAVLTLIPGSSPAAGPQASGPAADPFLNRAYAILRSTPLIDGHNDLPWAIRIWKESPGDVERYDLRQPAPAPGQTDLPRLSQGRVGGQFWSVYIPGEKETKELGYAKVQLEQIEVARRVIERYPDRLELALSASEVMPIFRRGKIASMLGMEATRSRTPWAPCAPSTRSACAT